MKTITPQLPTIFGSGAAMLIAFLSLLTGTSPGTCLMKALAAFLVFAGFGLVLRFALSDVRDHHEADSLPAPNARLPQGQLDMILPGTSVADLLGVQGGMDTAHDAEEAA